MTKPTIALCQTDMEWGAVEHNLRRAERLVSSAAADVAVLPEMFATGFMTDPGPAAEPADGGRIAAAMRRWAGDGGHAVVATAAVRDGEGLRNRMFFVTPEGPGCSYDKRHLFRPGGEAAAYVAGSDRRVAEYAGCRFLLLVCYDLRFPVWSRCRGDYDAILCCASWSARRREVWRTLLRARAIENQCYVIGVNRTGSDPSTDYAGDSAVIDFMGRTVVEAGAGEELLRAELDLEAQRTFRRTFPAWMDADPFRLVQEG